VVSAANGHGYALCYEVSPVMPVHELFLIRTCSGRFRELARTEWQLCPPMARVDLTRAGVGSTDSLRSLLDRHIALHPRIQEYRFHSVHVQRIKEPRLRGQ